MADYLNIAGRVRTTAFDGVAMEAQEVKDLNQNKNQQEINADVQTELGDRYTKEETYSKEQLDDLITTPDVTHVSMVATDATTAVTDVLPTTGEANTIYRVGNWDGTQYDSTMYALYAWNSSAYVCLAVRSFVGEVYDVSVNHPDGQGNPTPYADLAAALGTSGANIPADIRRGGMSIKFIQGTVQSSDNKYVQYRFMRSTFTDAQFANTANWQGVDVEPNIGSQNLVTSGGATQNLLNVINLSAIANTGVVAAINIGEFGFNTSVNIIYYKTGENSYRELNPIKNAIYRYNNCYYKLDGTALVKELDITEILSKFNAIEEQIFPVTFVEGNNSFSISNGETIVFYNSSTNPANVYVRVASDTANIDVAVPLAGGKVVFYTASTDTTIVRIGGSGVINATRESELLGRIFLLEKDVKEAKTDIVELKSKVQKTLATQNNAFSIAQGEKVIICNTTANDINVYVRETASSSNINVAVPLKAGSAVIYDAEIATSIVRTSNDGIVIMRGNPNTYYFGKVEKTIQQLSLKEQELQQLIYKYDTFTAGNNAYNIQKGESVAFFNFSEEAANVYVRETASSSNISIAVPLNPGKHVVYKAQVDTTIVRVGGSGTISATRDTTIIGRLCIIENELASKHLSPIEIVPTTEMKDVSTLLAKMDYHNGPYQADVLEQIYALFDELCALHPNHIIKYDPMASSDVTQNVTISGVTYQITIYGMADVLAKMTTAGFSDYPEYAKLNGAAGQVEHSIVLDDESVYTFTYAATPSYKTYMYKLVDSTPTQLYTRNPKKNVLLTGAVHGNEIAAPFNLYMLICNLLDGKDEIFAQMRAQFDFFIVPCINGYGMYHVTRGNANRVNINRNFPNGWVLQNNNLSNVTERWNNNYSGPSAASEFETQLIMALHSVIQPMCAIDHHNYSKNEFQFYTEIRSNYFLPLTYRALELCSLAFRKGLPSYFGNDYKLFIGNGYEHAPVKIAQNNPSCGCYFGNNTVFGATLEISECINYNNGQYTTVWEDDFGNDAFSIAEYTLRTQLALYLNEILKL